MALQTLIAALEREGEAEISALLAAGAAEAEEIRRAAEARVEARRDAAEADRDLRRGVEVERAVLEARRAARRAVLEARDRMLGRVFAEASTRLPAALAAPGYRERLRAELTEALACLGDRPGLLRCHPSLLDAIGERLGAGGDLGVAADPGTGSGFRLQSRDGAVTIDGTLEDRLRRNAPRLRQVVLEGMRTDHAHMG